MFGSNFGNGFTGSQIARGDEDIFRSQRLDPRGNNELGTQFQRYGAAMGPQAASRIAFNQGAEQDYQGIIRDLLGRIGNRNYALQGQRAGARVAANYGQAANLADQRARALGLGQGAQLGTAQGLSQAATRDANAMHESYLDPRRRDQDLAGLLQVLQQVLSENPALAQQQGLFGAVETRSNANAAARANRGLGGIVGSIFGQLAGSGALSKLGR